MKNAANSVNHNEPQSAQERRLIPLDSNATPNPRICVVLSLNGDPHFVVLGDFLDGLIVLGCLIDEAGQVLEWLELRMQQVEGLGSILARHGNAPGNTQLDQRWQEWVERRKQTHAGLHISTLWEKNGALPVLINTQSLAPVYLNGASEAGRWELCTADQTLNTAGLPSYHTTRARYLRRIDAPEGGASFVALSEECTQTAQVLPLNTIPGAPVRKLIFNPYAGRLEASRLCPMLLTEYSDLLSGLPWEGLPDGSQRFDLGPGLNELCQWGDSQPRLGFMLAEASSRCLRLKEIFHLKLSALLQALKQIHAAVQHGQAPLLNISEASFRVRFGNLNQGLPFLWTAECFLVKEGGALAKTLENTRERYFIPMDSAASPIFHAEGIPSHGVCQGDFRVRGVLAEKEGAVIQGTLSQASPRNLSQQDLIWLRVPLSTGRLDLYGHVDPLQKAGVGEIAFRSIPQAISEQDADWMKRAFKLPQCSFEVIPAFGAPFDLYSFAVLAVRCLLTDKTRSFNEAVDNLLRFSAKLAQNHNPQIPLATRVSNLLDEWSDTLGPQNLINETISLDEAFESVPRNLWSELLGWLAALLPGKGPDSFCPSLNGLADARVEEPLDLPIERLQVIVLRAKSLIFNDARQTAEIRKAINQVLAKL